MGAKRQKKRLLFAAGAAVVAHGCASEAPPPSAQPGVATPPAVRTATEQYTEAGVRVDVHDYLRENYFPPLTHHQEQERAIEVVAASIQSLIENADEPDALRALVDARAPYLLCLHHTAQQSGFSSARIIEDIEILTLNSAAKIAAYSQANYNLRGRYARATRADAARICPETMNSNE